MPSRPVVVRHVAVGQVWYAMPAWLLNETADHVVTAILPGFRGQAGTGSSWRETLARFRSQHWEMHDVTWRTNRVVWLTPVHASHAIGFDTSDHTLDVVVDPDGTWPLKDEDQLADAIDAGIYTLVEATDIRAEAERVIATLAVRLPTGWETWQPSPEWPLLSLPAGWDVA